MATLTVSRETSTLPLPGKLRMFARGLARRCPICGQGRLFRGLKMVDDCPRCGLHFERIEGHWIGAIGINTIVTFGLLAITLVGGLVATFPDFPVGRLIAVGIAVSILVPILFHPSSRMFWTAIDLAMRPPEAHEINWSILDSESIGNSATSTKKAPREQDD